MVVFEFGEYKIELEDDNSYTINSVDNSFKYDFVYNDEEATYYQSSDHSVKIYRNEKLYKSAIICATGATTSVRANSAIVVDGNILICCANKVFSLSLPELKLNWMNQFDLACCFQIFKNDIGIFIHGEIDVSRINKDGKLIWSQSFADITVTPEGKESFIMHKDFIEIEDWNHTKYKLNFDGKFI
jgi:hypothetical protein